MCWPVQDRPITGQLAGLSDTTVNRIVLRFGKVGAKLFRILSILTVRDSLSDSLLHELPIRTPSINIASDSASAALLMLVCIAHVHHASS
jgi:hypothetical protein